MMCSFTKAKIARESPNLKTNVSRYCAVIPRRFSLALRWPSMYLAGAFGFRNRFEDAAERFGNR